MFEQLKPRLKNQVLDCIFKRQYQMFNFAFEGCDVKFMREIFCNTQFHYVVPETEKDREQFKTMALPRWMKDNEEPIIEQAGNIPSNVYFIISGQIHLMNKDGLYEYAILSEGSYFGDISLLRDQPEEFSYFYNPYHEQPILMLTVNAEKFTQICDSYPLSREVLSQRAREKKQIFQNYKTVTLIKYMRTIIKNPNVLQLKKKG